MIGETPEDLLPTFLTDADNRWRARQRLLPEIVYHYTSASTLRPILESQRVRATIASETNDTTELLHAVSRWQTTINRHAIAATLPEYQALYPHQALTFDYLRGGGASAFVACFSGRQDDPPQWNLYGEDFTGVAIGFDSAALDRLDRADVRQNVGFSGIQYEELEQDEFFDWLLARWEKEAAPALGPGLLRSTNPLRYIARWLGTLATTALSIFPRMKEPSFRFEDEWRVGHLHFGGVTPCCQVQSGDFKTHVALDLGQLTGRLPIVSVWLGPAVANNESEKRVRDLLQDFGYDVPVKPSRVPLRIEQRPVRL